eukprot:TRINITY_DN17044_c0_g1_i1.p1 TRINITY_DN17044_c0_g1~~TRINITY_DN17044_c0_g1_i1.p1  ORF type:complete len:323 (-),score=83.75 TRINITY_DN17044_c0_g1_i1:84-1052(-)
MIFGIYSLTIFHSRLKGIKDPNNAVLEDAFGPYLLVVVFILALILSAVIPTLNLTTQPIKYPIVPSSLPRSPDLYSFTAPLTTTSFYWTNRTKGLDSLLVSLQALAMTGVGVSFPLHMEGAKDLLEERNISVYNVKDLKQNLVPDFSVYEDSGEFLLDITSLHPSFARIHHNNQSGKGKESFMLTVDCSSTRFSLQSSCYRTSPVVLKRLQDVDMLFVNSVVVLGVPGNAQLIKSRIQRYTWKKDLMLADTPSSLILQLDYEVMSTPQNMTNIRLEPKEATLILRFEEIFRTSSMLSSARAFMTQLVMLQWNNQWPEVCSAT